LGFFGTTEAAVGGAASSAIDSVGIAGRPIGEAFEAVAAAAPGAAAAGSPAPLPLPFVGVTSIGGSAAPWNPT